MPYDDGRSAEFVLAAARMSASASGPQDWEGFHDRMLLILDAARIRPGNAGETTSALLDIVHYPDVDDVDFVLSQMEQALAPSPSP